MRVAVSGSSGFIGRALCAELAARRFEVRRIVRQPSADRRDILWSPSEGVREPQLLEDLDAVIHLAGENIAGGLRWTQAKKERIRQSRVEGTRRLVEALLRTQRPPRALLSASAIGIYGHRGDELLTEESAPGTSGFLADVAQQWEAAAAAAANAGIRVCHLRFGLVLGKQGGALPQMLGIFRLGLGGRLGSGRQWWSWIALGDVVRAIVHLLQNDHCQGPFNIVAPSPVTNTEFTRTLAAVLRRPAFFSVPAWLLRALMGEMAEELLLASVRVAPQRLKRSGFDFEHTNLEAALRSLLD